MLLARLENPILVRGTSTTLNLLDIKTDEQGSLEVVVIDILNGNVVYKWSTNVSSTPYSTSISIDLSNLDHDTMLAIYVKSDKSHMYLNAVAVAEWVGESPGAICDIYYIANGVIVSTRGSTIVLPRNNAITIIAYDKQHKCVYVYKGDQCQTIVCGGSAIVELSIKLPRNALYAYSAYIDDPDIYDILWKVPDLVPVIGAAYAVKQAVRAYPLRLVGVSFSFDDQYVYVKTKAYVSLESPFSWWALAKIIAGVACIVAGGLALVGSFGVATPLSISLMVLGGGLIGAGVQEFSDDLAQAYSRSIVEAASVVAEESKKEMSETRESLEQYLNQLVQQGKITEDEKNKILSYVDKIIDEANEAMTKLRDMVKKAYEAGYRDGVESQKTLIIAAGVAGFVIGYLVASR